MGRTALPAGHAQFDNAIMTLEDPIPLVSSPGGFTRIVVAHDGLSASDHVLDLTAGLVARSALPVDVVTVFSPGISESATRVETERAVASRLGTPNVVTLASNDVPEAIAEYLVQLVRPTSRADKQERPLLCLASHGRGRWSEFIVGSVSEELVRRVSSPILLAGPEARPITSLSTSLLVCLDGSHASEQILAVARDWVASFGGDLRLIEVVDGDDDDRNPKRHLHRALVWLHAHGTDAVSEVIVAESAQAGIVEAGRRLGVSAVAMTTHGRGRVRRLEFGSVALDVVREAMRPVLLLNPNADTSESDQSA